MFRQLVDRKVAAADARRRAEAHVAAAKVQRIKNAAISAMKAEISFVTDKDWTFEYADGIISARFRFNGWRQGCNETMALVLSRSVVSDKPHYSLSVYAEPHDSSLKHSQWFLPEKITPELLLEFIQEFC